MPTPSDSSAPQRHSVWGRVTDPGGAVVPAEVFWVHAEHAGKETVGLFDVHKVAHADNEGRFWAPDLPAGPCLLVPDVHRLHVVGDQVRIAHGTPITLPTTQEEVALTFPRRRTEFGSIYGVVLDQADRRPGAHLAVALVDAAGNVLREAETRSDGRFEFPFLLSPAMYTVRINGSRHHLGGAIPADLGRNRRLDLTIEQFRHPPGPRAPVRARVERVDGTPIAHARVRVAIPELSLAPVKTRADGLAEFGDLPARPARVLAEAAGYWPAGTTLPDGDVADPADVIVTLERAARLRVHVIDAATERPVRHANVIVSHAGGDECTWGGVLPPPDQPPRDFQDISVRQGPVTVRAESPGYSRSEATVVVAATQDPTVPVTLRLQRRA